jgi:hypothetical protein
MVPVFGGNPQTCINWAANFYKDHFIYVVLNRNRSGSIYLAFNRLFPKNNTEVPTISTGKEIFQFTLKYKVH